MMSIESVLCEAAAVLLPKFVEAVKAGHRQRMRDIAEEMARAEEFEARQLEKERATSKPR